MKAVLLLTAVLASVQASWLPSSSQVSVADETFDVPGENPLRHCADPKDDILELENVDLDPNPPLPGKVLTITATGNLSEAIKEGATIQLQVKYGLITIIRQTADLCETISNVDLECPVEAGKITITKNVTLPKAIPPGKYHVLADALTKDEEKVTCLTADVEFHTGGSSSYKEDV